MQIGDQILGRFDAGSLGRARLGDNRLFFPAQPAQ
jgi:hypothetical protein